MKTTDRRRLLALLGASALAGCAPLARTDTDIVGQATNDPFEGGIGGTGIVGTVTGFGGLRVNGLELAVRPSTRVRTAYGSIDPGAIAAGQTLTVTATRTRSGFEARDIAIDYTLVGELRGAGNGLSVNGVRVRVERGAFRRADQGQRVAVSGLWQADGSVLASRIDAAPDQPDLVAGTVGATGPGRYSIGSLPIVPRGTAPVDGSYAVAIGTMAEGALDADRVRSGRFGSRVPIRQLSIEGYLEPAPGNPGFRVAGLGHSFAPDLRLSPLGSERAIYFGPYNGLFGARSAFVLPEGVAERTALLAPGVTERFDGRILRV